MAADANRFDTHVIDLIGRKQLCGAKDIDGKVAVARATEHPECRLDRR